ncbi:hypothetical protein K2X33_03860 [bacterium]|nr:hypothetical protein [bacterium]
MFVRLLSVVAVFMSAWPAWGDAIRDLEELGLDTQQARVVVRAREESLKAKDPEIEVRVFHRPNPNGGDEQVIVLFGETHVMGKHWQKVSYPVVDAFDSVGLESYVGDEHTQDDLQNFAAVASEFEESEAPGAGPGAIRYLREKMGSDKMAKFLKKGRVNLKGQDVYWLERNHKSDKREREFFRKFSELTGPIRFGNKLFNWGLLGLGGSWYFGSWKAAACSAASCALGFLIYRAGVLYANESPDAKKLSLNALLGARNKSMIRNLVKAVDGQKQTEPMLAVVGRAHMTSCATLLAKVGGTEPTISDVLVAEHGFKEFVFEDD